MSKNGDAARSYSEDGWQVFPCEINGKKPHSRLAPHGFKNASSATRQVEEWWREVPTANIGIATGAASGVFVIDVDTKHDGRASWLVLCDGRSVETASVQTPSGGAHFYFRMPSSGEVRCSVSMLGAGIDVRGDGGYIVAPCSTTDVGGYRWRDDTAVAEAPFWLLEMLVSTPRPSAGKSENPIPHGRRNDTLARLAGKLRYIGLSNDALTVALLVENLARCQPPLPDAEVRRIAESIGRYPASEVPSAPIRFRTAAELARQAPEATEFVLTGYAAIGCITDITGAPKRSGKTTFLAHAASAILNGHSFLGLPTRQSPVVWLTEEGAATFLEPLRATGILGREDFYFASWFETRETPWPDLMAQATAKCLEVGAGLLVVDTLPQFAGLRGDSENNAGDALKAVEPLRVAAEAGIAVVVNRHDRKAGGDIGDSARGSSAFGGACDIMVSIRRCEGGSKPTLRLIQGLSRFPQTLESQIVELTERGYVSRGGAARVAVDDAIAALLECLPSEHGLTVEEITEKLPNHGRTVIQTALSELGDAVGRAGRGRKGDPYRFFRVLDDSADANSPSGGRNHSGGGQ